MNALGGSAHTDRLRTALVVLGVIALALLAWMLRHVALLLFGAVLASLFLTSLSRPLARAFKLNASIALAATVLGFFGVLALIGAFFGWRIAAQVSQAVALLPQALQVFLAWMNASAFGSRLLADFSQLHIDAVLPTLTQIPGYALSTIGVAAEIFLVLIGGIYLAAQPELYRNGVLRLLSPRVRGRFGEVLDESGAMLRKWLLAQLIAMATVGVAVGVGMWVIGAPAPVALGLFAGLAEFVPVVGPIVSAVPALLLALLVGLDRAGWTLALFVVIQQIEGNVLIPLIQRQIVSLPPVLTLFALAAVGVVFGPLGVLVSTPLTIVGVVLVKRFYLDESATPEATAKASVR